MTSLLWHGRIRAMAPNVSPLLRAMLSAVMASEGLDPDSLLFVADALEEEAQLQELAGEIAAAEQLRKLADLPRNQPPASVRVQDAPSQDQKVHTRRDTCALGWLSGPIYISETGNRADQEAAQKLLDVVLAASGGDDLKWWWGLDCPPQRLNGPFDSRATAAENVLATIGSAYRAKLVGNPCKIRMCQGAPGLLLDDVFDPDWVIAAFVEWNDALHDDEADLLLSASDGQKAELRRYLAAALKAWRERHDLGRPLPRETRNDEILLVHIKAETHPC